MATRRMSSREFNQDTSGAKRAAEKGPVIITERGRPAHVLLSFAEYRKLSERQPHLVEILAMPDVADIELDIPKRTSKPRRVDLD